jgi:hypothetical protein
VASYEGLYEVSYWGHVRSLSRLVGGPHGPASRVFPGRLLEWYIRPDGYPEVQLSREGRAKKRFVHHVVLEAHVGPRPAGQEARHGPGGKLRPWVINLCWGIREDNVGPDRVRDGQSNRGERHGNAKRTTDEVLEIRRRAAAGEPQTDLAGEYGMSVQGLNDIVTRRNWAHVA